jgi:serine/threonine protein phosphatase PrpC
MSDLQKKTSPKYAAKLLSEQVRLLSDNIYDTANKDRIGFGATLSGVWLVDDYAIFINLGDSRGYLLPRYKKNILQVTRDHNVAALLVERGELTKKEARNRPSSSSLMSFVGMPAPATPEVFIRQINPGDCLLLCSDGLHGMVDEEELPRLMRSSRNPDKICKILIDKANANGGRDNISAVYIKTHPYE